MTYDIFGRGYVFLEPEWFWLLAIVPILWLPLFWQQARWVLFSAAVLRTLAVVALLAGLAGLSRQTTQSEHTLALVAAIDASDSISRDGRVWMNDYLARLRGHLTAEDEFSAVSFDTDTSVLVPPGPPISVNIPVETTQTDTPNSGGGTNIAKALERVSALYPEQAQKRLLLMTDGNETSGSARQHLALARQMGISIFPVIPPSGQHPEISLEKFVTPPLVREGSVFTLRLVVRNGNTQPVKGTATIRANDDRLTSQQVQLQPGLSVFEVPVQIMDRGNYLLRAEIKATPDTISGNNRQDATLSVAGKIRSLVITDNPRTHLARALQLKEVDIEFRGPEGVPSKLEELLDYNCLVFDDIGRGGISDTQMDVIERYVRDFGGGFLMAGGTKAFGDLAFKNTAVERVLPVTFQKQPPPKPKKMKKKRLPIALFLLIDRSNSMGYNSKVRGLHDGQKMHYAQEAALAVLRQLKDTDLAGAVAFDSEAYILSDLAPMSQNRQHLNNRIERLQYGGGTDFFRALETAADQLGRARRAIRHIILLTDGDTNRSPTDHYPLVSLISQRQISITTIRIGADTVNLRLLSYMSEKTKGRFHHVKNIEQLPLLMVKDTKRALGQEDIEDDDEDEDDEPKEIHPLIGTRGQILRGLKNFPDLDEYMLTDPKKGANVQLYADVKKEKDPILATWQYGLGKVVAVTFDPSGSGSGDWIRWPGFGKFWSQAVRWAIRDETAWEYRISMPQRHNRTILRVESYDTDQDGILQARLPRGASSDLVTLMPVAPRVYEAVMTKKQQGSFPVTIIRRKSGKVINQKTQTVMASQITDASLDEYRQQHPNRDLLRDLAEGTGGQMDVQPEELVTQKREGTRKILHPMQNMMMIATVFLLLGDISLRTLFGPPAE